MVAISLYRGNLHRVSDTPRRWPLLPPAISLRQFKILTRKRREALSRLTATNPTPDVKHQGKSNQEDKGGGGGEGRAEVAPPTRQVSPSIDPQPSIFQPKGEEDATEHEPLRQQTMVVASASDASPAGKREEEVRDSGPADKVDGKVEVRNSSDTVSDKEERKQEVEKKLRVLNDKKHNLVQMLKLILNAEEEIKRRSMQSPVLRPSVPQKAEMPLETGSTKQVPKLTVEVNFGSDSGGESDAAVNHNSYVRQLHQIHSTSPSAASLTRTTFGSFQHNAGLQNSRATIGHGPTTPNALIGAMASPSRFAPTGHQSQSTGLPPVTLPGNHFMASSPSPAASGGASSVFMDPRLTSSS